MNYRELIELYKTGKLPEEMKEKVEKDIERQEVIGEYLFDKEEEEGLLFEKAFGMHGDTDTGEISGEKLLYEDGNERNYTEKEQDFTKIIQKSIRKTFLKFGTVTGAVVLAVVLFLMFLLPRIEDGIYYDPDKTVGEKNGIKTNRLSLDLSVYTELFLPKRHIEQAEVIRNGSGKYDILLSQISSYSGNFQSAAGMVNKGKMILYDADYLKTPTGNAFEPGFNRDFGTSSEPDAREMEEDTELQIFGPAGTAKTARAETEELIDQKIYTAYVTLDHVMKYPEFAGWEEEKEVNAAWCALCFTNNLPEGTVGPKYRTAMFGNIGFSYSMSSSQLFFDREKYPLLTAFSMSETLHEEGSDILLDGKEQAASEENIQTHVCSMLRFLEDEGQFCDLMGISEECSDTEDLQKDIKEQGIHIYGFTVNGTKEEIKKLWDIEHVAYIYTEEYD